MEKNPLAIATMMDVVDPNSENGRAVRENIRYLSTTGLPIFIADSGRSDKSFLEEIANLDKVTLIRDVSGGLDDQHKVSILAASNEDRDVLYTEPDKVYWSKTTRGLSRALARWYELRAQGYEFAAVARNNPQMSSFPLPQVIAEASTNALITSYIGLEERFKEVFHKGDNSLSVGDFLFGPKFMVPVVANLLRNFDETKQQGVWWGVLTYLIGASKRNGFDIATIMEGSDCPENQREEKNAIYRARQQVGNWEGFEMGLGERLK